jgi:hypothetical protein
MRRESLATVPPPRAPALDSEGGSMEPPVRRSLRHRLERQKYTFLLLGLGILLFLDPVCRHLLGPQLSGLLFLFVIAAALQASISSRAQGLVGFALGIPAALLVVGRTVLPDTTIIVTVSFATVALLLAHTVYRIQHSILRQKTVEWDVVLGSVCVYLLLGVMWALAYQFLSFEDPGHFPSAAELPEEDRRSFGLWFYHSIVTLTTLGYGDLTPATATARLLTSLEALVGQLYIALTIARMVGMHLAHRTRPGDSGSS